MYQWLSEAVENNSIIITANRRLARILKSAYDKEQLVHGHKVWLSPNIQFLNDWLISNINNTANLSPIIIGSYASSIIWQQCLKERVGDTILNIGTLVLQAKESWQRLHDWQVPLSETSRKARNKDEKLFAKVACKYQTHLMENNWIDDAQVASTAIDLMKSRVIPVPDRIVYAGFNRVVPVVNHLFRVMEDIKCVVTSAQTNKTPNDASVAVFDNADAELRAAGAWARQLLMENPSTTIGIISSSLDRNAAKSERLVREGIAPGWQYSNLDLRTIVTTTYGQPLSDYPPIKIALLLLEWVHRDLSFNEISLLLRTQFMTSNETVGRCKLELYLRRLPEQPWSPINISHLFRKIAKEADGYKWLEGIQYISSFQVDPLERASPAAWADRIDALLQQLAWPGTRKLVGDELQLINRWRELLNELARLEIICPKLTFSETSNHLILLANKTIYQLEAQLDTVQLLRPLEAVGTKFDSVWITGLDANTWPPAAYPLTLISRNLQRQYSMPDSTPGDTLKHSWEVLNLLLCSADIVRLSWQRSNEESENIASPLIAKYALVDQKQAIDPGWHALNLIGSHQIEQPADDSTLAVQQDEFIAGGAITVQRQSTDPFSAFAHGRLRVTELKSVAVGLSPALRGSLIHKALHTLFAEKPSQDQIRQWLDDGLLQERVLSAADSALKRYLWHADPILKRLFSLERVRLRELLEKFVTEELKRPIFCVDSVERDVNFQQFGVRLKLRIDRIDRLSDESLLIADYKTGLPKNLLNSSGDPQDLQLVVYACALDENVGGLVLINIDPRSIEYKGTGGSSGWDAKRADQWAKRMDNWKEKVAMTMQQIAAGDIRINLNLSTKQTRPLNILSRFEERKRGQR